MALTKVAQPAEANFVLNTGPDDHRNPTDMAEFEDVLRDCARHHLPMICANPDLHVIRGGVRVLCAGSLALRYQELGGDVRSIGKPDPAIYQPVLQSLDLPVARVLAVGDALHTDIAGAAGVDIAACWVLGGIHGEALADELGRFDLGRAEAAARNEGVAPIATIPRLAGDSSGRRPTRRPARNPRSRHDGESDAENEPRRIPSGESSNLPSFPRKRGPSLGSSPRFREGRHFAGMTARFAVHELDNSIIPPRSLGGQRCDEQGGSLTMSSINRLS